MTVDFKFSLGDKVWMREKELRQYGSPWGIVTGLDCMECGIHFYRILYRDGTATSEESLLELAVSPKA